MSLSVFDIFKIGIGPSSSHTMGPMNAARSFAQLLAARDLLERTAQVSAQLYGSLALTGRGHCTDRAILLGLEGFSPETIDSSMIEPTLQRIRGSGRIRLLGRYEIGFDEPLNLLFHIDQVLPGHSNGMRFTAHDAALQVLAREEYYSIGGGFIVQAGAQADAGAARREPPYEFNSAARLLEHGRTQGLEIHELVLARERTWRSDAEIRAGLMRIWQVMQDCVRRGFEAQGLLPGVLGVRRRAPKLYRQLMSGDPLSPMHALDWVNVFALAVNEEMRPAGRLSRRRPMGRRASCQRFCTTTGASSREPTTTASFASCSPPPPLACSTSKTRPFPVPTWDVKAKSASLVPWRPRDWCRRSTAAMNKSRMPPKSAWSTISA